MVKCFYCDEDVEMLPFKCNYCGNFHCKDHRLPEQHECSFSLLEKPSVRKGSNRPISYMATKTNYRTPRSSSFLTRLSGAQLLLILSFTMFILTFIIPPQLLYLSISNYILPSFWYHTILTAMFIPPFSSFGFFLIFNMIFYVFIVYFLGRTIESRFGRNNFLKIYFLGSLITGGTVLLLQLLFSFSNPFAYLYIFSSSQGGIMALVAFIARNTPEREIRLYLYFIPVRLKMKHLLWIYIGFQALNLIGNPTPIQPIANILGLFGGIIILNSLRGPRQAFSPF